MNEPPTESDGTSEVNPSRPATIIAASAMLVAMALGFAGLAIYAVYDAVRGTSDGLMPMLGLTLAYLGMAAFYGTTGRALWQRRNVVSRGVFGALVLAPVGYFIRQVGQNDLAIMVWLVMVLLLVSLLAAPTRDAVDFERTADGR
ncbi:hypothetical protein [Haloglycomyces albus]|uniref:hypothetical protein n=1 Tax=Haloglycomyces albus TaxID=526067 RepID=UPI0012EB5D4F|nr:hypothetical protein [Haloglycomyces albus]